MNFKVTTLDQSAINAILTSNHTDGIVFHAQPNTTYEIAEIIIADVSNYSYGKQTPITLDLKTTCGLWLSPKWLVEHSTLSKLETSWRPQ